MGFKNESQLRGLFSKNATQRLYRIEAALGGTDGLPDTFALPGGAMRFAELKKGEVSRMGTLRYRVRSSQVDTLPKMVEDGASGVFAVAQVGSFYVRVFDVGAPGALDGKVELFHLETEGGVKIRRRGAILGVEVQWIIYGAKAYETLKAMGMAD